MNSVLTDSESSVCCGQALLRVKSLKGVYCGVADEEQVMLHPFTKTTKNHHHLSHLAGSVHYIAF